MSLVQLKPTARILTPEGWVQWNYMDEDTLEAVKTYCAEQIKAERQRLLAEVEGLTKQRDYSDWPAGREYWPLSNEQIAYNNALDAVKKLLTPKEQSK